MQLLDLASLPAYFDVRQLEVAAASLARAQGLSQDPELSRLLRDLQSTVQKARLSPWACTTFNFGFTPLVLLRPSQLP